MSHRVIIIMLVFSLYVSCGGPSSPPEGPVNQEADYLRSGREIALASFAVISGKLQKELTEGGVEQAIDFCHQNVYPIFASLSLSYNAEIKRTSFKLRNQKNFPSVVERYALKKYEESQEAGASLEPQIVNGEDGRAIFIAPILIQPLCLRCHGELGKDLREIDYSHILARYPRDRAIGYQIGQLRGIWSVTFNEDG
ncbi:MAG: DUF3365 domain-containing protein [Saprospiraceae bacterium]|nr:DUF3365 domain-containing protein [Saprospiraceae bacterium]